MSRLMTSNNIDLKKRQDQFLIPETQHISRGYDRMFGQASNHDHLIERVDEVYEECKEDSWDGDGANAVTVKCVELAKCFIRALGFGSDPEIEAEPNGYITIDWELEDSDYLSISVDPEGFLHTSVSYGKEEYTGKAEFNLESPIPDIVAHYVKIF